jgi:hypothetical protein
MRNPASFDITLVMLLRVQAMKATKEFTRIVQAKAHSLFFFFFEETRAVNFVKHASPKLHSLYRHHGEATTRYT